MHQTFQPPMLTGVSDTRRHQDHHSRHAGLWRQASNLFWQAYSAGVAGRVVTLLTRRPAKLYELNQLCCSASRQHYAGIQAVRLSQIRGTEGRSSDFDADFHPLTLRMSQRWIHVALAILQGSALPAVQLIQVGDVYFVRDGHHRISAARAWDQEFIDAEVTVWDVPHPLPWEQPVASTKALARLRSVLTL